MLRLLHLAPSHHGDGSRVALSENESAISLPSRADRVRVSLNLNRTLDRNIELYALATASTKTEVVATALTEFLQNVPVPPPADSDPQRDKTYAVLVVSRALQRQIHLYASAHGWTKTRAIIAALAYFLRNRKIDPYSEDLFERVHKLFTKGFKDILSTP